MGKGPISSYLTKEEIKVLIDEAHESGLATSHCVGGVGLDWALETGLDSLEHAYHINDAQIEKLARVIYMAGINTKPPRSKHVITCLQH